MSYIEMQYKSEALRKEMCIRDRRGGGACSGEIFTEINYAEQRGQGPVLHCGVFRCSEKRNFEKQINHCGWLRMLQLTV